MLRLSKKIWIPVFCGIFALLIIMAFLLLGPRREQQPKTKSLTTKYTVQQMKAVPLTKDFLAASMDFGLNFLNYEANIKQNKNVLTSPASALFALGMAGNGAAGKTLEEFEQVLGNGLSIEDLSESYGSLLQQYATVPPEKLTVADSIWLKADDHSVLPSFLEANSRYFRQDVYSSPTLNEAADDINVWVSKQTNGLIPMLYGPNETIDDTTFMILINTIYFHMGWEQEFNPAATREANFYPSPGEQAKALMMNCQENMQYLEENGAIGFLKPYQEEGFSFLAILPPEGQTPEEYLSSLTGQKFLELLARTTPKEISLTMPKFQLECQMNLNNFLLDAGMQTAFGAADFSRMCTAPAYISSVIQKTCIELDEKGTKAAAVTAVQMDSGMAAPVTEIILDRPFLYAILDSKNNFPLFLGILNEP